MMKNNETHPSPVRVSGIRFSHYKVAETTIGGGETSPTLSWTIGNAPSGWKQNRVQIEVSGDNAGSFVLDTSETIFIPWPSAPLSSLQHVDVRVRVAGQDGVWSEWSEPVSYETGLLSKGDWKAMPVTPGAENTREDPAPVMFRSFTVDGKSTNARLNITSGGVFIAYIDGRRIGDDQLAPGWTEYDKRVTARTYDVTEMLGPGEHEIAVLLGNGWYRGQLSWACRTNVYGDRLWLLAQLDWTDGNGTHMLGTGSDWSWRESNILYNDLYDGQRTDLRRPMLGDDSIVHGVETLPMTPADIVPAEAPAARIVSELPGREVVTTPSGKRIVDFGQNVSGWVRMAVHFGKSGDKVVLRHAEVLEHGELGVRPLRNAKASDEYILSDGDTILEPCLTQHGFRYVQVEGIEDFQAGDLTACVVSADMERTAEFNCSDHDVDRLFENARWSAIDNFITIPTDCPQRDERLGWTGDIAVFAPTATSLFDSGSFLNSWLVDMASDQGEDGGIPVVVPDVLDGPKLTCGWGDASVLVPWAVYQSTGDKTVLERFVPMMDSFIDGVASVCDGYLWKGGFQFGDWLDPDAPADDPGKSKADPDIVATAYFAHSTGIVAETHRIVGDDEGAERYLRLKENIVKAWRDEYTTANGAILSDCATVYSMALAWDLLADDRQRRGAAERLADIVRVSGFRISTGFLGTPLVCDALEKSGHGDLAVRLLLQRRCPSWLYPVSMGATTIWERWDSMLPNGDINPGEMTSFNHYALGAVADWLLTGIAGIKRTTAAWRHVVINPVIGHGIDSADASQKTPYGTIHVEWKLEKSRFELHLDLPYGITADVILPDGRIVECQAGTYDWHSTVDAHHAEESDMTIADLLDSAQLMDDLTKRLAECGSPVYAGPDPDVTFAKACKQWLRAPIGMLPSIASMQGYVPLPEKITAAAETFLEIMRQA
mgnify:FL=1